MKKFIVLEGGDGAGKSSCAEELAHQIDGVYYKTPPALIGSIRKEIEATGDLNLRLFYYLTGTFYASHEITELLKSKHVVCDRYIYTTIAYHKALGVEVSINIEKKVLQPDYAFCLFVQPEELKKRISARCVLGTFDNDFDLQKKVMQEFSIFPLEFIDTTLSTVLETVEKIRERIKI